MSKKQLCGNCGWARFELTPAGNRRRNTPGKCEWPEPEYAAPFWYRRANNSRLINRTVWPDDPSWEEVCPTWKPVSETRG